MSFGVAPVEGLLHSKANSQTFANLRGLSMVGFGQIRKRLRIYRACPKSNLAVPAKDTGNVRKIHKKI